MLAPDSVLAGKYRVLRLLDSGGMGHVYEAWQADLGRTVAVKLLQADVANDPVMTERFRREAGVLGALGHPNIVQIIEFRADAGAPPILVMEKLEGAPLKQVLKAEAPMPASRAVVIALQILAALAAAHRANVVHRDMKPGNVFLLRTLAVPDFVKVIDFGIARIDPKGLSRALTGMGEVMGTLAYMAPEQALGEALDGRADLFSVGAILFEALSGQRARVFDAASAYAPLFAACRPLRDAAPAVDPRLAAVVDRALALRPADRFESAEAMATALVPFASGPGPVTEPAVSRASVPTEIEARTPTLPPPTTGARGPRLAWLLLPAGLVVGALVVAGFLLFGSTSSEEGAHTPVDRAETPPREKRAASPVPHSSSLGIPACDRYLAHMVQQASLAATADARDLWLYQAKTMRDVIAAYPAAAHNINCAANDKALCGTPGVKCD